MCRMKSGIILKDRIFVPDYDSHTKMLDELLQISLSLRMPAEDFGEMCRKAYAEFKTY